MSLRHRLRHVFVACALLGSLFAANAYAQPGAGMPHHPPRDCSQAQDKATCEAHRAEFKKMQEACQDKGADRRQCMEQQMQQAMQNRDCSQAPDAARCEAMKKAATACTGKTGAEHRACMKEQRPAKDCSQAKDQQRCEQHRQAAEQCQSKPQGERRDCMRQAGGKK